MVSTPPRHLELGYRLSLESGAAGGLAVAHLDDGAFIGALLLKRQPISTYFSLPEILQLTELPKVGRNQMFSIFDCYNF